MSQVSLKTSPREKTGTRGSKAIRKLGQVPAVLYGKGQDNLHFTLGARDLEKAVGGEKGHNTLLELEVEGKKHLAILHNHQAHPIKRNFTHADFFAVDPKKEIQVNVPIKLTGRAQGVKEGGVLDQVTREIRLSCLPAKIPAQLSKDITSLTLGQSLHIDDFELPEGVKKASDTNVTIASIKTTRASVEATKDEETAAGDDKKEEGGDKAAAEKKEEKK